MTQRRSTQAEMDPANHRLRVVAAVPISEELVELVTRAEPRVDFVRDQSLLPPMRYPGDHSGDPAFRRTAEEQARFESLVDSAEALYGVPDEKTGELSRTVNANPRLRWIHAMPAGAGAQLRAAKLTREQLDRVAVTTSAGVHAEPLAEFAIFGLLAGAKDLGRLQHLKSAHEWPERWHMKQLYQQTILVVGLGSIGRATAAKLSALGARVIGTSRHGATSEGVSEVIHPDDIARTVSRVDGIVVTLPGTDSTRGLISHEVLQAVRPGCTVVNVGRGAVIDEPSLIDALVDGRVGFAALDVFATEPLPEDNPLWSLPNVLISPHTSALNTDIDRGIAELFARNATRLLDHEPLINLVDTVEFY
jgi:phosphoglycerate dehydrogenase-like enzyme